MYHHGEDPHLCGATVAEFDRALRRLGLLTKFVPRRLADVHIDGAVSGERTLHLHHHKQLVHADRKNDLQDTARWDLGERGQTVGHVREFDVVVDGQHAWQANVLLHDTADHREHGNAAVLDLPKTVGPFLVCVLKELERVPGTDGRLRADLDLEAHIHGGGMLVVRPNHWTTQSQSSD